MRVREAQCEIFLKIWGWNSGRNFGEAEHLALTCPDAAQNKAGLAKLGQNYRIFTVDELIYLLARHSAHLKSI